MSEGRAIGCRGGLRRTAPVQNTVVRGRRSTALRPRLWRVLHVFIHQHRRPGVLFLHECHCAWTVRLRAAPDRPVILSRIVTGYEPSVLYGSDDPEIRRRVDRIRARRFTRSRTSCFKSGPLRSASGRRDARRLGPERICAVVGEIYFALTTLMVETKPGAEVAVGAAFTGDPDHPETWLPAAGPRSLWERYLAAHARGVEGHNRSDLCGTILKEIIGRCPSVRRAVKEDPNLGIYLLELLSERAAVGGGPGAGVRGSRAARASVEALALNLGAAVLGRGYKISRRVRIEDGHVYVGTFDAESACRPTA